MATMTVGCRQHLQPLTGRSRLKKLKLAFFAGCWFAQAFITPPSRSEGDVIGENQRKSLVLTTHHQGYLEWKRNIGHTSAN
jgi:hypothetical protein